MDVFVQDAAGQRRGMVVKEQDTLAEVVKEAERVLNYEVKGCTELWYDGVAVAVAGEGGGSSFCGLTGISAGEDVQAVYSNAKLKERFVAGEIPFNASSPDVMRDDAELVLLVAQHSPSSMVHALPSLRGNKGFMLAAFNNELVSEKVEVLRCATPELLDDAGFATDIIKASTGVDDHVLEVFSPRLQTDARLRVLQKAVRERLLPDAALSDDTEIAMLQISKWDNHFENCFWDGRWWTSFQRECCLQHVSERLQGDKDFVLSAVKHDGLNLRYATEHLRNDPDVVRAAVQDNGLALCFVPVGEEEEPPMDYIYMKTEDLLVLCTRRSISLPQYCDSSKPNLVRLLVEHDKEEKDKEREMGQPPAKKQKTEGGASLCSNEEIVLMAVENKWESVCFATGAAKESKAVAMVLVKKNARLLKGLSKELKKDKSVVLTAVRTDGAALRYVKKDFGDDRDVALIACISGGWDYISDRLKEDKEVALRAVVHSGRVFSKLSTTLRNDREVALVAVKRARGVLDLLGEDLKNSLGLSLDFALAARDSIDRSWCLDTKGLEKLKESVMSSSVREKPATEGDKPKSETGVLVRDGIQKEA
eukprot:TRINITY_DN3406_c0_g1_i4.p1 TRINITY_DN3406_c0_g1~~TRINITY_DN3406_c0_g1_i4.p1  ORF type:complete len:592 (+),score=167.79 TRINITY_DN3406_c0_g1_i4:54-1829(+)